LSYTRTGGYPSRFGGPWSRTLRPVLTRLADFGGEE